MTRETETPFSLRRTLVAGAVASAVGLSTAPALAQMVCSSHTAIKERLESGYQETRSAVGLSANNAIVEVYTSEKGTFTIVLVRPNGLACLMAVGTDYHTIKPSTPARWAVAPLQRPHGDSLPAM